MVLHCHAQIIAYLMIYSVLDLHKKKNYTMHELKQNLFLYQGHRRGNYNLPYIY